MNNCIYTSDKLICQEQINLSDLLPKAPSKTRDRDDCAYASNPHDDPEIPAKLSKPELNRLTKDNFKLMKDVLLNFGREGGKELHIEFVREIFGNTDASRRIAKWLLFAPKSWSVDQKRAINYYLNRKNFNKLAELIGMDFGKIKKLVAVDLVERYKEEISSGEFEYTRKDFREYHPLQNVKSELRDCAFREAGYKFEIDIVGCAWTMIYNLGIDAGLNRRLENWHLLEKFCDQKQKNLMISRWSLQIGVDRSVMKQIMLALLHGGKKSKSGEIFKILELNETKLSRLQRCSSLRRFILVVRQVVRSHKRKLISELDLDPNSSIGRICHLLYTKMEDQVVRSSWTKFFKMKGIKFFQIHDGGYISEKIELDELERFVLDDIGINIKIEMNDL